MQLIQAGASSNEGSKIGQRLVSLMRQLMKIEKAHKNSPLAKVRVIVTTPPPSIP